LLGYALGIAVAFVSPPLSLTIYGLMAVYYLFDHLPAVARKTVDPPRESEGLAPMPDRLDRPTELMERGSR
jgi:hypothetical protein